MDREKLEMERKINLLRGKKLSNVVINDNGEHSDEWMIITFMDGSTLRIESGTHDYEYGGLYLGDINIPIEQCKDKNGTVLKEGDKIEFTAIFTGKTTFEVKIVDFAYCMVDSYGNVEGKLKYLQDKIEKLPDNTELTSHYWIIRGEDEFDEETDECLYWSNVDGWVKEVQATHFTEEQSKIVNLPIGGVWEKRYMKEKE